MEAYVAEHLGVLRSRREALTRALPARAPGPLAGFIGDDAFACESRGFYAGAPRAAPAAAAKPPRRKRKGRAGASPAEGGAGVRKPEKTVPVWTARLDKLVRTCLRKFGWGEWARIAHTNKFPSGFTAKTIARRARALGYSRDNVPTAAKKN